jgi:HK97 family phage prohead protease
MTLHLESPFELKFQADNGRFEGYASVFGVVDSARDRVAPGAFRRSIAAARDKGAAPPMLWQHDAAQPIGAWRRIEEDSHGLFVEGDLFINDISRAREAYKLMQEKVATVYAAVHAVGGNETVRDGGLRARQTCRIITRYRDDIGADMRLADGDIHYDIIAVLDRDGRRQYLEVTALRDA